LGSTRTAALQVFDDTDTNVEEDVFHELIEGSPHLCLTVRCPEENISAGLSEGKSIITLETYFQGLQCNYPGDKILGQINTFTFSRR
jgi:hypothetical protein